jgi:hypothetical protein
MEGLRHAPKYTCCLFDTFFRVSVPLLKEAKLSVRAFLCIMFYMGSMSYLDNLHLFLVLYIVKNKVGEKWKPTSNALFPRLQYCKVSLTHRVNIKRRPN